jgi:hypothetical protein
MSFTLRLSPATLQPSDWAGLLPISNDPNETRKVSQGLNIGFV